ncbi:MAG TPA: hypothetical protein VJS92_15325, partial [Candidatus Polarisedimenticolaceae bacterium]|nr:hypothetical protein [Candidatus Polarisedimenticolaceae bacterium]
AQQRLREAVEALRQEQFGAVGRAVELRNRVRAAAEALERNRVRRERLEVEHNENRADWARHRADATSLEEGMRQQVQRLDALRAGFTAAEQALREARQREAAAVEGLAGAREMEQSSATRLRTLEDVATRFAGVSDGVRTLLGGGAAGVRTLGVVADYIQAGREVEGAAESYLRPFLPTVILEDDADVRRAAELLRAAGAGRTSLVARSQPTGGPAIGATPAAASAMPAEVLEAPGVIGRLLDRLTLNTSANGVIHGRLGDAILVESLETALRLHRRWPQADYLTADGDVVYASGIVAAGGNPQGDQGLLAHNRKIEEARAQARQAAARAAAEQSALEAARSVFAQAELELAARREELAQAERLQLELELRGRRSAEETERSERHSAVLGEELAAIEQELGELAGQRAS